MDKITEDLPAIRIRCRLVIFCHISTVVIAGLRSRSHAIAFRAASAARNRRHGSSCKNDTQGATSCREAGSPGNPRPAVRKAAPSSATRAS